MNNSSTAYGQKEPIGLRAVLRILYVLVFLVGLCGNLFVCIIVIQQRRMRTVINYFTLNLAVSDLIFIIIYLPSQLAAYENGGWPFGNVGCLIAYTIVPVCLTASISTLLAISCERFRGIVFPFQPRLSVKAVRNILIAIWLVSFGTALPVMTVAGTIQKDDTVYCDEKWSNVASSRFYWISMFLVQYIMPLFAMIILYGIAGWKLNRRSKITSSRGQNYNINSDAEMARQRQSQKITNMLVALIILYAFCMLPQHVIYFWSTYGAFWDWPYSLIVFRISNLFPMANSALNSIAYGTLQTDFRNGYKKLFKSCNIFARRREASQHFKRRQGSNSTVARKLYQERKESDVKKPSKNHVELNVDSPLLQRDSTTTSDSSRQLDDVENHKNVLLKAIELKNIEEDDKITQTPKTFLKVNMTSGSREEIKNDTNLIFNMDNLAFLKHSKETYL